MEDNSEVKTSTDPVQTESVSTNGSDVSKENSTVSIPIADKPDKITENSNQTVNCYW